MKECYSVKDQRKVNLMGCHTWCYRPMEKHEWSEMKKNAPKEILKLTGDTPDNRWTGMYDPALYDSLMRSYNENIPCVYGKYWWQLGYGSFRLNATEIRGERGLFVNVRKYNDIFRVDNYPIKVIHNRRELRKWMRKRYFELEDRQLEKVSEFFREYPCGVIVFG